MSALTRWFVVSVTQQRVVSVLCVCVPAIMSRCFGDGGCVCVHLMAPHPVTFGYRQESGVSAAKGEEEEGK